MGGKGQMIGIESGNLIAARILNGHAPRTSIGGNLTQFDPFSGKANKRNRRESLFAAMFRESNVTIISSLAFLF